MSKTLILLLAFCGVLAVGGVVFVVIGVVLELKGG